MQVCPRSTADGCQRKAGPRAARFSSCRRLPPDGQPQLHATAEPSPDGPPADGATAPRARCGSAAPAAAHAAPTASACAAAVATGGTAHVRHAFSVVSHFRAQLSCPDVAGLLSCDGYPPVICTCGPSFTGLEKLIGLPRLCGRRQTGAPGTTQQQLFFMPAYSGVGPAQVSTSTPVISGIQQRPFRAA